MNTFNIIGNLTKDPELKYLPNGVEMVNFSIAYNEKYKKNGEKIEVTHFFECEAWSGLAKLINDYFKKGHKIGLTGKLKQERWEDNEGKQRNKVKLAVQEIDFLTSKDKREIQTSEPNIVTDNDIPF